MSITPEIYDEVAYCYDGSLEGLFSAIFAAYANHEDPSDMASKQLLQLRLTQRTSFIETNMEHADRVYRGLVKTCGTSTFNTIRKASLSDDPKTGTAIYRFVRYAMDKSQANKNALSNITHPAVEPLFKIARAVDNECEKMRQFIRFEHLKDENSDFWFARCNPRDSVIPLIMNHFVERFNIQPFIIYDENHELAGVYDGKRWLLVRLDNAVSNERDGLLPYALPPRSADEDQTQRAWKSFYHAVTVEARYNPELRRQFMPKRLWKNITELSGDL